MKSKNHKLGENSSLVFTTQVALCLFCLISLLGGSACGPRYVRSGEDTGFEDAAMSTRLDRRDLENMFDRASKSLIESGLMKSWKAFNRDGRQMTLATLPVDNETTEHVESSLSTLIKKLETSLINEGDVTVISRSHQPEVLAEIRNQQGTAFDPTRVAEFGRQLGAQYLLTGKLYDVAEKSEQGRRVQYFLFIQVIEVETGAIRWQVEVETLKGLKAG